LRFLPEKVKKEMCIDLELRIGYDRLGEEK